MLRRKREGFTMIEMLAVIAIIGILASIIFPVISSARRRAKQTQCMSNMYNTFTAVKAFKLDEHRYPDFIAGPVQYDGLDVIPLEETNGMVGDRIVSLYPEYIKSTNGLRCSLASLNVTGKEFSTTDVVADPMAGYGGGGKNGLRANNAFELYLYSSYDYQQPRTGVGGAPSPVLGVHYSTTRLDMNVAASMDDADVQRQLRWRTPPESTVITWCSYHRGRNIGKSKDVVLWLDGHAKPVPSDAVESSGWRMPRGG